MSTDLTRHEGTNLPDRMQYAKALASASLLPRAYQQNPGNVLLAMELGDALGVPPIQAITGIHVIEGKPSASADLIASLVRKAGHRLRVTGDDQSATAQIIRADDPDFTYEVTWTLERAKAAGLTGKGVWKSYPAAMLKARAITEVARAGASDALYGVIYTPEEIGAQVTGSGEPVQHVESTVTVEPPQRSGNARLAEAVQARTAQAEPVDVTHLPEAPDEPATADSAPEPTPEPEPEPEVEMITPAQTRKMGAQMKEAGLEQRADALAYVGGQIGREITSRNQLTKSEASRVIDALETLLNSQPQPEPGEPEPANDDPWARAAQSAEQQETGQ